MGGRRRILNHILIHGVILRYIRLRIILPIRGRIARLPAVPPPSYFLVESNVVGVVVGTDSSVAGSSTPHPVANSATNANSTHDKVLDAQLFIPGPAFFIIAQ